STAPVCLPAPKRMYLGTADALAENLREMPDGIRYVLVVSADHVYEMDYRKLLRFHVQHGGNATIGSVVYPKVASRLFGILEIDAIGRVVGFQEKPASPAELPGQPGKVLANMGIYVFSKDALLKSLKTDAADQSSVHDIGRNILPRLVTEN